MFVLNLNFFLRGDLLYVTSAKFGKKIYWIQFQRKVWTANIGLSEWVCIMKISGNIHFIYARGLRPLLNSPRVHFKNALFESKKKCEILEIFCLVLLMHLIITTFNYNKLLHNLNLNLNNDNASKKNSW